DGSPDRASRAGRSRGARRASGRNWGMGIPGELEVPACYSPFLRQREPYHPLPPRGLSSQKRCGDNGDGGRTIIFLACLPTPCQNGAMDIHIPTLFLTLTAASTVLALALAFVAFRSRRDGMPLWALAIACHALAYLLFSLRDQAPYICTVVGANFLLTASLAIFGEGLYQFHQRRPPRLVLWLPVALSLGVTASLPDNLEGRIFLSGIINGWQGLLLLALILRQRQATRGRGQYLLMAGFATMLALSALRSGATALGKMDIATLTATNPVQALSFMATLATLILVAVGVVVMTKEQAEVRLVHSQAFSRGILNAIISEIAVLDHRGVIIEVNDAWQR